MLVFFIKSEKHIIGVEISKAYMKNIYHKHSIKMKNIYQGIYMKEPGEKHKNNIFYKAYINITNHFRHTHTKPQIGDI